MSCVPGKPAKRLEEISEYEASAKTCRVRPTIVSHIRSYLGPNIALTRGNKYGGLKLYIK